MMSLMGIVVLLSNKNIWTSKISETVGPSRCSSSLHLLSSHGVTSLGSSLNSVGSRQHHRINNDFPPSHKHIAYPPKATRLITAIHYGQQLCSSVPIRAHVPEVADPSSLSGDYNKHVRAFTTGQRFDGIYIISCFVVDHYYTRLGRCSLFMLLSLNYFPLVSPSLCLGRSHLVGVDQLWHEEQRNQTPISQQRRYQTFTTEVSCSAFASVGTSERNDTSRSFGALVRFTNRTQQLRRPILGCWYNAAVHL